MLPIVGFLVGMVWFGRWLARDEGDFVLGQMAKTVGASHLTNSWDRTTTEQVPGA
jgi:hypothetical protein